MDFDALYHANFKMLDDAVGDWNLLVGNLEKLETQAEDGLHKAANKASWAGINAQMTKEFVGKTAGEFADAHTQAKTIHSILSDTVGELKRYQEDLEKAIGRGQKKHLTVTSTGDGGFTVRAAKGHTPSEHDQSEVTALRDEVQKILNQATDSDSSASKVLTAIADQSELGFSDAKYKNRDEAAAAIKTAEELAKIARKNPEDLTVKDFDRINAGLKKYKNDELFSERFATTLGPQKTMEFWAGINDPGVNWDVGRDRRDQLDDMQRNLGMTLAHASQSDSTAMDKWRRNVIELGDKPIYGDKGGPMGFQVMSNLMRTGDYDDQFMKDYGTKLMATERKLTGNGEHANMAWQHMGTDQTLNRIGDDSGSDPLTGYLKGISNSPDAATAFFNEQFVSKNDPDNPFEHDTDGDGNMGKKELSNFQYLFEEREWPEETNFHGDDINTGRNNLALALEAATTGHPAGEIPTLDTPAHNAEQAKLFESIVSSISDDNTRLTGHSYMSDSMGQIASEYLPDMNRAMTDDSDGDTDRLFPVSGTAATPDHRDVTRFLMSVGQNPEGYAAVEVGQKKYMGNLMEYHLNPDLPTDQRYSTDPKFTVQQIAYGSGEVSGTLAIGRQEAVAGPADVKDKAYDHSIAQWKNLASGTVGTVTGVGTALIASPVAGAAAGGAAGTASSMLLEELFKNAEGDEKSNSGQKMGEHWENGMDRNIHYTERAAEEAAKANHQKLPDVGEWARTGARDGFNSAETNIRATGADLQTDI
ncbi:hypothetical protein CG723_15140 [Streptomyces sp. CB01635]|uniref:hypothetical protein n=1 Tax=unclassified Streptomyces TaxID=2593676 RepID=UPI000C27B8FC|nr:hypothetical protein [Streptomyces sp. CB01635]PJN10556.1 hypothetical protein CG723_15140 [Streptomyces sp. CB01635]